MGTIDEITLNMETRTVEMREWKTSYKWERGESMIWVSYKVYLMMVAREKNLNMIKRLKRNR